MAENELYRGGCLCGAIRYEAEGPPSSINLCFCTQCQRQTGSPLPAFLAVPAANLRLVQGEPTSFRSSARATRRFCGRCGTPLFWQEEGGDGVDIFLGTLDDRASVPPPEYAIWAQHRLPWVPALAGVPEYPGARQ